MIRHWEEYEDGPTQPIAERLHATINYKGTILLNGNLHEKLGLPKAVKLVFDRKNSVIGVIAVPETRENAFPVTAQRTGRHRLIRASPFCRKFGIRISSTNIFRKPEIDEDGILQLDLNSTTPIRRRASKRT